MKWVAWLGLVALGGAACAGDTAAPAREQREVIGGILDAGEDGIVSLFMLPSLATGGVGWTCTGVLVSPRVVLTTAQCVLDKDGLPARSGAVSFGYDQAAPAATIDIVDTRLHRLFNFEQKGRDDLAVALLASDAPVAPMSLNADPLEDVLVAGTVDMPTTVRAVGYGPNETDGSGSGVRRQSDLPVAQVSIKTFIVGDDMDMICSGDAGGPDFFDMGAGEVIVGLHSFAHDGPVLCAPFSVTTRVDVYLEDFIVIAIDAWDGPCAADGACVTTGCRSPDPDCDPCLPDGTCMEGCAVADWDCPLGKLLGDTCAADLDCEARHCVGAPDDERIQYCSAECDPQNPAFVCGGAMDCVASGGTDLCVFPTPTPTAQGAPCTSGGDCRSGLCDVEFHICVEECDPAGAACPDGYECSPSSLAAHVCRPPDEGGGGCLTVAPGRGKTPLVPAAFAAAVLLAGLYLARRR